MLPPSSTGSTTPSPSADDEALNAMVATDLSEYFGRDHVFQLPVSDERTGASRPGPQFYSTPPPPITSSCPASRPVPRSPSPSAGDRDEEKGRRRRPGGGGCRCSSSLLGRTCASSLQGTSPILKAGQELISLIKGRQHGS